MALSTVREASDIKQVTQVTQVTLSRINSMLAKFPKPPSCSPAPRGWGDEYADSLEELGSSTTLSDMYGLDSSILELFVAFSAGRVSNEQLVRLCSVLSTLDPLSLTRYSVLAVASASKDISVLQRTSSSPSTPKNKGMRTRIKGLFGKGAANVPVVRLESAASALSNYLIFVLLFFCSLVSPSFLLLAVLFIFLLIFFSIVVRVRVLFSLYCKTQC